MAMKTPLKTLFYAALLIGVIFVSDLVINPSNDFAKRERGNDRAVKALLPLSDENRNPASSPKFATRDSSQKTSYNPKDAALDNNTSIAREKKEPVSDKNSRAGSGANAFIKNIVESAGKTLPSNISYNIKFPRGREKTAQSKSEGQRGALITIDCLYNKMAGQQCGGGEQPAETLGTCRRPVLLAFYTNCNYGNWPQERFVSGYQQCLAINPTSACACAPVWTPGCGLVLRLFPPGCNGCCPPLPVSAEQCCGGSAWLWDSASGWVGCAE